MPHCFEALELGLLYTPGDTVVVRVQNALGDTALVIEAEGVVISGTRFPDSVAVTVMTVPVKVSGHAVREVTLDVLNDVAELMALVEFDRLTGVALRVPAAWPWIRIGPVKKGSAA